MERSLTDGAVPSAGDGWSRDSILDRLEAALGRCVRAAERIEAQRRISGPLEAEVRAAIADLDRLLDQANG